MKTKKLNHESDLLAHGYNAHVYSVDTFNGFTSECFIEITTGAYMIAVYVGDTLLWVFDDDEIEAVE